jgi:hypothetical protein
MFIGLILIAIIAYFLFFRRQPYRHVYQNEPYYSPRSGMGSFVGGMAAGSLLTYLLEQGRIGMDEYNYYNSIGEQQMLNELMDQNLIQQDEINDLRYQMDQQNDNSYSDFNDTFFDGYTDDDTF